MFTPLQGFVQTRVTRSPKSCLTRMMNSDFRLQKCSGLAGKFRGHSQFPAEYEWMIKVESGGWGGWTAKVCTVPIKGSAMSILKPKEEERGHTPMAFGRESSAKGSLSLPAKWGSLHPPHMVLVRVNPKNPMSMCIGD